MLLKKIAVVLCSALLLPLAAGEKILFKDGDSVAFMGDSITNYGWSRPGGYIRLTVEALKDAGINISVIPAGVSANKSTDMHARLKRSVISKKPVWMTLSCGVNDVWHTKGVGLDEYKKEVTAIVDECEAAGIKVIILTPTMITENPAYGHNKKLGLYCDWLRAFAKERDLPLADLHAEMIRTVTAAKEEAEKNGTPRRIYTRDGVHMNHLGDQMMATGLLRALGVSGERIEKVRRNVWDHLPAAENKVHLSNLELQAMEKLCNERGIKAADFIRECVLKELKINK